MNPLKSGSELIHQITSTYSRQLRRTRAIVRSQFIKSYIPVRNAA